MNPHKNFAYSGTSCICLDCLDESVGYDQNTKQSVLIQTWTGLILKYICQWIGIMSTTGPQLLFSPTLMALQSLQTRIISQAQSTLFMTYLNVGVLGF